MKRGLPIGTQEERDSVEKLSAEAKGAFQTAHSGVEQAFRQKKHAHKVCTDLSASIVRLNSELRQQKDKLLKATEEYEQRCQELEEVQTDLRNATGSCSSSGMKPLSPSSNADEITLWLLSEPKYVEAWFEWSKAGKVGPTPMPESLTVEDAQGGVSGMGVESAVGIGDEGEEAPDTRAHGASSEGWLADAANALEHARAAGPSIEMLELPNLGGGDEPQILPQAVPKSAGFTSKSKGTGKGLRFDPYGVSEESLPSAHEVEDEDLLYETPDAYSAILKFRGLEAKHSKSCG